MEKQKLQQLIERTSLQYKVSGQIRIIKQRTFKDGKLISVSGNCNDVSGLIRFTEKYLYDTNGILESIILQETFSGYEKIRTLTNRRELLSEKDVYSKSSILKVFQNNRIASISNFYQNGDLKTTSVFNYKDDKNYTITATYPTDKIRYVDSIVDNIMNERKEYTIVSNNHYILKENIKFNYTRDGQVFDQIIFRYNNEELSEITLLKDNKFYTEIYKDNKIEKTSITYTTAIGLVTETTDVETNVILERITRDNYSNIETKEIFNEVGDVSEVIETIYPEGASKGRTMRKIYYNVENEKKSFVNSVEEYTYNGKEYLLIKKSDYIQGVTDEITTVYNYHENSNVLSEKSYTVSNEEDENKYLKTISKYNKKGEEIFKETLSSENEDVSTITTTYYSSDGEIVNQSEQKQYYLDDCLNIIEE